jgi:hypothetical protein
MPARIFLASAWALEMSRVQMPSSELGPLAQNPFLALIAPLHGGKKVMFPIPKHDQMMVRYFKELIESGEFRIVVDSHE